MLAAAAMALQVAVPRGFMPAAVSGGWYLQLCPDGLSAEVMQVLLGDQHQHHHHHGGHHDGHQGSSADTGKPCELAGLYADALAMFAVNAAGPEPAPTPALFAASHQPRASRFTSYLSRAPPANTHS